MGFENFQASGYWILVHPDLGAEDFTISMLVGVGFQHVQTLGYGILDFQASWYGTYHVKASCRVWDFNISRLPIMEFGNFHSIEF